MFISTEKKVKIPLITPMTIDDSGNKANTVEMTPSVLQKLVKLSKGTKIYFLEFIYILIK